MTDFFCEVIQKLGLPLEQQLGAKITIFDFLGILVEGHKGLVSYTSAKVILRVGGKQLVIGGKNLIFYEVNADEIYIRGKITSLEVVDA